MLGVNVIGLNTYYAGLRREQQLYYFCWGMALPVMRR